MQGIPYVLMVVGAVLDAFDCVNTISEALLLYKGFFTLHVRTELRYVLPDTL